MQTWPRWLRQPGAVSSLTLGFLACRWQALAWLPRGTAVRVETEAAGEASGVVGGVA